MQRFSTKPTRAPVVAILSLLCCATFIGCGASQEPRIIATGVVTFDGNPISEGVISFIPLDLTKGVTMDARLSDGRYTILSNHPQVKGRYRVEIQGYKSTGREVPNLLVSDRQKASRGEMEEKQPYVPAKYNVNSELTAEITEKTSSIDFEL